MHTLYALCKTCLVIKGAEQPLYLHSPISSFAFHYLLVYEPRCETRSDNNQAVQPHKMARGLKFRN